MSNNCEDLRAALHHGDMFLCNNDDPKCKADVWKKFRLIKIKATNELLLGWSACKDCFVCLKFKAKQTDGSVRLYGTKNLADHCKTCSSKGESQSSVASFFKKTPGKHFTREEGKRVKDAEVRMVVQGGTSFMFVDNPGLRLFAQKMIQIGSMYGNLDVNDVLFGRETVKKSTFEKMNECQEKIKKSIAECSLNKMVAFTTDLATDNINHNSYLDFTVFWIDGSWTLNHSMYRCSYFPEKHTAVNIEKVIDENLSELNLSLVDTPCTTDKGSNFICATLAKTHVDCACHRINTVIDIAWKQAMDSNPELKLLDQSAHTLVKFVNQACGIQSELPTTLKHGGETRPWRSLHSMFFSILVSRETLVIELRKRKRENLMYHFDIDLLREVVEFLSGFSDLFDLLEYANKPTLQNVVPVYYTLYELWQIKEEDSEIQQVLKAEFLPVLTEKLWNSIGMLHLSATFLDPSLRSFTFVRSKVDREGFFRQIKESLLILAKEVAQTNESVNIEDVAITNFELDQSNLDMQPQKKVKYDPFSWFQINETTTPTTTNQITNIDLQFNGELQMYIQETVPKRENFNLLDWWKQNKLRFPLLSIIAMRLLVIQASSSESERHFSAFNARHIVTSQRNAMLPETIEAVSVVLEGYKNNLI